MFEIYEKQEDGSLRPIEYPAHLAKRLNTYLWLKSHGLSLEEIRLIIVEFNTA